MKNVLITGVSRGLGKALVELFLLNGWKVFGLYRESSHAPEFNHKHFTPIIADITNDNCERILASALNNEPLHLVINNAGRGGMSYRLKDVKANDLQLLFETHCIGVLRVTRACIENLLQTQDAAIVNINSRMGSVTGQYSGKYDHLERSFEYRVAKAAQNMLAACMFGEFGKKICIFQVHPGRIKTATAQTDAVLEPSEAAEKIFALLNSGILKSGEGIYDAETGELYPW